MGRLHAMRIALCSTINWEIGYDLPTSASKRTNVKPTLRVEGSFFIDYDSFLLSRDVGTTA